MNNPAAAATDVGLLRELQDRVGERLQEWVSEQQHDVFALTLQPEFFAAVGYLRVDRARYPEKIRRDCLGCVRRFACNEICFAKNLMLEAAVRAA